MKKKTSKSHNPRAFRRRLLAVSTAVISGVPVLCSALGLGDIQYKSYLGEPLSAEIDLVNLPGDIDRNNLKVRQVDRDEASQLGVEIISNWHRFQFEVDTSKRDFQVQILSRSPIKEPYINILVELAWPKGTIYREYTLFLDPAPVIPTVAAREAQPLSVTRPAPTGFTQETERAKGTAAYRVQAGDTLYGIAKSVVSENGGTVNATANWLFSHNPQAFIDGDMNRLVAGRDLALPVGVAQLARASAQPSPASVTAEPAPQQGPQGRLVLEQPVTVEGANELDMLAAAEGANLQEQLSSSRAVLDYLVKENRDLKDRLSYLESSEYLATLRQLVELQKNEIADLREQLAVDEAVNVSSVAAPVKPQAANPQATVSDDVTRASMVAAPSLSAGIASIDSAFSASEVNKQTIWAAVSSSLAIGLAALLALFVWRSRKPASAPLTVQSIADEKPAPSFIYKDGKKEVAIDEYLDINVALAQKDVLKKVDDIASNDFTIDVEQDIVSYDASADTQQASASIDEVLDESTAESVVSLQSIAEKVQQERAKVEDLQKRIKQKTENYSSRKKDGVDEAFSHVEEIEVDSDLEQYLKF